MITTFEQLREQKGSGAQHRRTLNITIGMQVFNHIISGGYGGTRELERLSAYT